MTRTRFQTAYFRTQERCRPGVPCRRVSEYAGRDDDLDELVYGAEAGDPADSEQTEM